MLKFGSSGIMIREAGMFEKALFCLCLILRGCSAKFYCEESLFSYTISANSSYAVHFIVSAIGAPTVVELHSHGNSSIVKDVNCSKLRNFEKGGIVLSKIPSHAQSLQFVNLYEYRDDNDVAKIDSHLVVKSIPMEKLNWHFKGNATKLTDLLQLKLSADSGQSLEVLSNGSLSVDVKLSESSGRSSDLPHMMLSPDIVQLQFSLDRLAANSSRSRYAVALELSSSDQAAAPYVVESTRSIDDESSPGVFELYDWTGRNSTTFAQWKPIVYTGALHKLSKSTRASFYGPAASSSHSDSVLSGMALRLLSGSSLNVSFGMSKDGFYNSTAYSSWTFTFGHGLPPADGISIMIILIIAIGLGIPILLIICGSIFVCVKRRRVNVAYVNIESYSAIN